MVLESGLGCWCHNCDIEELWSLVKFFNLSLSACEVLRGSTKKVSQTENNNEVSIHLLWQCERQKMALALISPHGRAAGGGQMDQCRWRELSQAEEHCTKGLFLGWRGGRDEKARSGKVKNPRMRRSPPSHLMVPKLKTLIRNLQMEVS